MINKKYFEKNNILLFFLTTLSQILIMAFLLIKIFKLNIYELKDQSNIPEVVKIIYLSTLYIIVLSNIYFFDKKSFKSFFYQNKKLFFFFIGLFLGIISLSTFFVIGLLFNFILLEKIIINPSLIIEIIFLSLLITVGEELLFRNFILKNLKKKFNYQKSSVISAYLYAQVHFLNFNLELIEIIIPIVNLFILGLILNYFANKINIWLSVGLHMGWIILISYLNQINAFKYPPEYIVYSGGQNIISGYLCTLILLISFIFIARSNLKLRSVSPISTS